MFGYKAGAQMVGLVAPSSRVFYGPWARTQAQFTNDGLVLFDAAVAWAMDNK